MARRERDQWGEWWTSGAARAAKRENNPLAVAAKLDLREKVLAELGPANVRVLDAYCGGGSGGMLMYRGAWKKAALWVGCDGRPWDPKTDPPRFQADNRRLFRCLDLSQFNVVDLDAYGAPWEQLLILSARWKFAPGAKGAIVVTDGSNLSMRMGGLPRALLQIIGNERLIPIASSAAAHDLQLLALRAWAAKSGLLIRRLWQASGTHSFRGEKKGGGDMLYTAMVFEGRAE